MTYRDDPETFDRLIVACQKFMGSENSLSSDQQIAGLQGIADEFFDGDFSELKRWWQEELSPGG